MTRAQQIAAALKVLDPPAARRDECRREIELVLDLVTKRASDIRAFKVFGSKKSRGDLRRYAQHLRAAQRIIRRLDPAIRPWFSYFLGALGQEIKTAEQWASDPSPKRDAVLVKAALEPTERMLRRWGHKVTLGRTGKWARLIKIAANTHNDVLRHMSTYWKNPVDSARLVDEDGVTVGVGRVWRGRRKI